MTKQVLYLILILIVNSCSYNSSPQIQKNNLSNDIDSLIKASEDVSISNALRKQFLIKANDNISNIENTTEKIKLYRSIAFGYLMLGDLDGFKNSSKVALEMSNKKKDTTNIAVFNYNLGYYYHAKYQPDSSFYFYSQALKNYRLLNDIAQEGAVLLNMAIIQERVRDFTGSEINTIKSISKLKNTTKNNSLYLAYNNLGGVYSKLRRYDLAVESHQEAINYLKKYKENDSRIAMSFNNIGHVYLLKQEYQEAIKYLQIGLEKNSKIKIQPKIFAMLVDNLAYSKFKLGQTNDLPALFYKSLKIRDSLQIFDGIVESTLHLSEYYLSKSDTVRAIKYGLEAKKNAERVKYNEGLLESYLLLSKLSSKQKDVKYLQQYIKLSDSLQENERTIREKFTRIAFQTDEIKLEKEAEVKKNWLLTVTLIIGSAFFLMVYIFLKQRAKNKELQFHQKQDETNIEIYNLLLSQQTIFQEGSNKEKKRISRELHDGILGRLFGTRLSLDTLNESTIESEILEREEYIEELQHIEEDIRKIAHNLKTSVFNSNASFIKLVEQLIAKQRKICSFECELNFNSLKNWENVANSIQINCYRILQESLQNINKYAKATKVQIDFYKEEENLVLTIKDDGVGFNTKTKKKGIGLKNMKSRAISLKGIIEFRSNKGKGTEVKMTIPLENIAE